jgi:DtxR family Mn-dependent transcriptional regulator
MVVRIGSPAALRQFDFADEVASALWVHSDAAHAGCSVPPMIEP